MPRVVLKPNSAEYADETDSKETHPCDMPGCPLQAEYKAPKHRGLNEYYHFCFEHVKEYNKAWDFFHGMSENEVQDHVEKSLYGDRPTWQYAADGSAEDILRQKAQQEYFGSDQQQHEQRSHRTIQHNTPETEALALMGLEPPVMLDDIKKRYKELAKKHHPDLNKGCKKSEELLKQINMAYTILKLAYEEYDKLMQKS